MSYKPSHPSSLSDSDSSNLSLRSSVLQVVDTTLRACVTSENHCLFDSNITALVADYCIPDSHPFHLILLNPVTCDMEVTDAYHSYSDLLDELEYMRNNLHQHLVDVLDTQSYIMNWAVADVAMFIYSQYHEIIVKALNLDDHLWKEWVTDTQQLAVIHNSLTDEQQLFFATKWNEVAQFAFTTEHQQQKIRDWMVSVISIVDQPFLPQRESADSFVNLPLSVELLLSYMTRLSHAQHAYRFISGHAFNGILACFEGDLVDATNSLSYENSSSSTYQLASAPIPVPVLVIQRQSGSGTLRMNPLSDNEFVSLMNDDQVRVSWLSEDEEEDDDEDSRQCLEVAFRNARRVW